MNRQMRVAQVFVDVNDIIKALNLPADSKIHGIDDLNLPLGFVAMCIESPKLPIHDIDPGRKLATVLLSELQEKPDSMYLAKGMRADY